MSLNLKRWLPDGQDSVLLALLLLTGGVAGAKDVFGIVFPADVATLCLVAVFATIVVTHVQRQRRIGRRHPLPAQPRIFNPFKISRDEKPFVPWLRDEEAAILADRLIESVRSHLVVTGPSGAGKSVLVRDLLPKVPKLSAYESCIFDRYDDIVRDLIEQFGGPPELAVKQKILLQHYGEFVVTSKCSVRTVLDSTFEHPKAADILQQEIVAYFTDVLKSHPRSVIIFDQAERLLHLVRIDAVRPEASSNGYRLYFFIKLLAHLRNIESVRTLFVIRAEYFYQSLDFLENIVASAPLIRYFLCPGINIKSSPAAVAQIRQDLKTIPGAAGYVEQFERIVGLDNRAYSNTFLTQLFAFMIEHFVTKDPLIREMLDKKNNRILAVKYYFSYLLNDYARANGLGDALEFLKAIIFTIAIENQVTGEPVTNDRIAALAHIPVDHVSEATAFLLTAGLIREEEFEHAVGYRMVHDLICDYVIENEQFAINPGLKDSIRGLSEARVSSERLTSVDRHTNPMLDLFMAPNIGLLSIWAFYVFGFLKARFPAVCDWSQGWLNWFPLSQDCQSIAPYYFATFFMHSVWLTFIYIMDRGYFCHVLRDDPKARFLSRMMPVIGAVLAVLFSQSPALFVMPVVVVGVIMGLLLVSGAARGPFSGRVAADNYQWGVRTAGNMIFAMTLSAITTLVLWNESSAMLLRDDISHWLNALTGSRMSIAESDVSVGWMYFANAMMIYFWWHIRSPQQGRLALATRLAEHDRSKSESRDT